MIYHYSSQEGITHHPTENSYPIENELYNLIIQEALELNIRPTQIWYYLDINQLYIEQSTPLALTTIIFTKTHIHHTIAYETHTTQANIPYEQYTTLKELLKA